MSYETYYDLLINACVRYDKIKKENIGKRRNVYNTNIDDTYVDNRNACIHHVPDSPYGGIDLPADEFYQVHTLSSRHPPSPRPGNPSRPSFRPQFHNSKHGSLVDRGANGGLAGSDVRILSRSSRKCTVTGIDSHELQGLDVVQCAALVETNHGIVNLIMNEYACYGKGHTIHSSGQIEWFKNSVDDRRCPSWSKTKDLHHGWLCHAIDLQRWPHVPLYPWLPTDKDLERYPTVHLTGPHEWDPSGLDYTHPSGDGEPPWLNDPNERFAFYPNFDEFGDYTQRAIQLSVFWMTHHPL